MGIYPSVKQNIDLTNWEHEIPKVKDYAVIRSTRFKKINNTLDSDTPMVLNPLKV